MIIQIKNLLVPIKLGIYREEQITFQDVRFDLGVTVSDAYKAGVSGDIDLTVNYASIVECVDEVVKEQAIGLVETVVEKTGQAILKSFPMVSNVDVEVTKSVFHDDAMRGAVVSVKKGFGRDG